MKNEVLRLKKLRSEVIQSQSVESNTGKRNTLRKAVEKYGYDNVMAASGWKESTIGQYLRNPNSTISSENLRLTISLLKEVFGQ